MAPSSIKPKQLLVSIGMCVGGGLIWYGLSSALLMPWSCYLLMALLMLIGQLVHMALGFIDSTQEVQVGALPAFFCHGLYGMTQSVYLACMGWLLWQATGAVTLPALVLGLISYVTQRIWAPSDEAQANATPLSYCIMILVFSLHSQCLPLLWSQVGLTAGWVSCLPLFIVACAPWFSPKLWARSSAGAVLGMWLGMLISLWTPVPHIAHLVTMGAGALLSHALPDRWNSECVLILALVGTFVLLPYMMAMGSVLTSGALLAIPMRWGLTGTLALGACLFPLRSISSLFERFIQNDDPQVDDVAFTPGKQKEILNQLMTLGS